MLGLLIPACGDRGSQDAAGSDNVQNLIIYTGRDKDEVARVVELFIRKTRNTRARSTRSPSARRLHWND